MRLIHDSPAAAAGSYMSAARLRDVQKFDALSFVCSSREVKSVCTASIANLWEHLTRQLIGVMLRPFVLLNKKTGRDDWRPVFSSKRHLE